MIKSFNKLYRKFLQHKIIAMNMKVSVIFLLDMLKKTKKIFF